MLVQPFDVGIVHSVKVDHLPVDVVRQRAVRVVDIGHPARHAGREVASGGAQDDDLAAGHVLATVVADTLDDRVGARVADRESFADHAAQERLAAGGAEQDHVAADDVVLGDVVDRGVVRRPHHDAPAGQTLADVVVGVAVDPQRDTPGQECTEAVARRAVERDVDGAVRKTLPTIGFGDLVAEHGADRPVDVRDRGREADRRPRVQGLAALGDQLLVQRLVQPVVLTRTAVQVLVHEGRLRLVQHR